MGKPPKSRKSFHGTMWEDEGYDGLWWFNMVYVCLCMFIYVCDWLWLCLHGFFSKYLQIVSNSQSIKIFQNPIIYIYLHPLVSNCIQLRCAAKYCLSSTQGCWRNGLGRAGSATIFQRLTSGTIVQNLHCRKGLGWFGIWTACIILYSQPSYIILEYFRSGMIG